MKLLILLILIAFPFNGEVLAQEVSDPTCKALERHKVINDATYRGGVDVNGNAVVPANLGTAPSIINNVTRIPLTIDLAERLGELETTTQSGLELEANFGILEIHQDGRVMYGDQDWTNNIQTLCGKSHKVMLDQKMDKMEKELPFETNKINTMQKPVVKTGKIKTVEVEVLDFPAPEEKILMVEPQLIEAPSNAEPKIITDKPELIPDEILQGGEFR